MADRIKRIREHLRRGQAIYRESERPTPADVRRAFERDRRLVDRRNREDAMSQGYRIDRPPTVDEQVEQANAAKRTWSQVHHGLRDMLPRLGDPAARIAWAELMLVALERDPTADDARRAEIGQFVDKVKAGQIGDSYRIG
jgi:hypothetical protein